MDGRKELDFALRYPFSSAAKALLESRETKVDDHLVQLAMERIKQAMEGKLARSSAPAAPFRQRPASPLKAIIVAAKRMGMSGATCHSQRV